MINSDQEYDVHAPASTYYTTGSNSGAYGVGRNRSVATFSVGAYLSQFGAYFDGGYLLFVNY
jgi:hypothetical protein